ncbi:MAG: sigma-70 family RNA polymerase sigma factor [Cytophagales bacterium]|nr:sigma-70 family RNA polymerase sigma factor [Cytophagales bacterium]
MKKEFAYSRERIEKEAAFDLNQKSDKEVWDLFKKGHEGAFGFIYKTHIHDLYQYGIRFCRDGETVKDCIQELFIDLRKSKNLKSTDSIKPYLFKALRFKLLGVLKKSQKIPIIHALGSEYQFNIEVSFEAKIINSQIEEENKMKLQKALSRLSNKQNELLHYFYVEDFSYRQIADIMGFSNVKSARNLIYKSIKRLRVEME